MANRDLLQGAQAEPEGENLCGNVRKRHLHPDLDSFDCHAVTEVPARGKDGMVTMLNCSVLRKETASLRSMVNEVDPDAFITSEDIRPIRRGFWGA